MLEIDRSTTQSLTRQIYHGLRDRILEGILKSGSKMPSTRTLASDLHVSRNVVMDAYGLLEAEGFVRSMEGSGTYVEDGLLLDSPRSETNHEYGSVGFQPYRTDIIDFRSGLPDLGAFPSAPWLREIRKAWDRITPRDLAYGAPEGRMELRAAIADYVATQRGMRTAPDQVVITGGTTQAIGLVGRLLFGERDGEPLAVLEDPVTSDIRHILSSCGIRILGSPIDSGGLNPRRLPENEMPSLIYTTPSHQFPLGSVLSASRRIRLVEYARYKDSWIVEDDYDSEFRFDTQPLAPLHVLDPDRTIYIGTFSKTLFPALRIGYLILPAPLVERGREVKWFSDLHNPVFEQLVLAGFLESGSYYRHLGRMRRLYQRRREALESALSAAFGPSVEMMGERTGLHLCARFPGTVFDEVLLGSLESAGVKVYPVEQHAIEAGRWEDTVILGYGRLDEEALNRGVAVLKSVLRS